MVRMMKCLLPLFLLVPSVLPAQGPPAGYKWSNVHEVENTRADFKVSLEGSGQFAIHELKIWVSENGTEWDENDALTVAPDPALGDDDNPITIVAVQSIPAGKYVKVMCVYYSSSGEHDFTISETQH